MEIEKTSVKEVSEKKTSKKKVATVISGIVNCERLNIRSEAKTGDNIIEVVEKDTVLKIDSSFEDKDFYKLDGKNAYCMKKFITVK